MSVKIHHIDIMNEEASRVHIPGQIIEGSVKLVVHHSCSIYSVTIGYYGVAKSKWIANAKGDARLHKGREEYVAVYELIGVGDPIKYKPGKYQFPFRFRLAPDVPRSYKGKNSTVSYIMKAMVKTPGIGQYSNVVVTHKHEHKITVRVIRDLNSIRDARQTPVCRQRIVYDSYFREEAGCRLADEGSVKYKIYIPRQGFIPGENLRFKAEVRNHCLYTSCTLNYALVQRVVNRRHDAICEAKLNATRTIAHLEGDVLYPKNYNENSIVKFQLPKKMPTSGLRRCGVVDIEYLICIEFLMFSGLYGFRSRYARIPVIIGDVPLKSPNNDFSTLEKWETPNGIVSKFIALFQRKKVHEYELYLKNRRNRKIPAPTKRRKQRIVHLPDIDISPVLASPRPSIFSQKLTQKSMKSEDTQTPNPKVARLKKK